MANIQSCRLSDNWIFIKKKKVFTLDGIFIVSISCSNQEDMVQSLLLWEMEKEREAYSEPCQTFTLNRVTKLIKRFFQNAPN